MRGRREDVLDEVFVILAAADYALAAALLRAVGAYARALDEAVVRDAYDAALVGNDVFHAEFAFGRDELRLALRRVLVAHFLKLLLDDAQKLLFVFED